MEIYWNSGNSAVLSIPMTRNLTILILLLALSALAFGQALPTNNVVVRPPKTTQTVSWAWSNPNPSGMVASTSVAVGTNGIWLQTNNYPPSVVMATFTNVPAFAIAPTNYAKAWFTGTNGLTSAAAVASYSGNALAITLTNPTTNLVQTATNGSGPLSTASWQTSVTATNPPGNVFYRLINPNEPLWAMLGVGTNVVVVTNAPLPNIQVSTFWVRLS